MELSEIASIVTILSIFPFSFIFHRRERHKNYFSVTWKLSRYLRPRDLLGERPFQKYYEVRDFDQHISKALKEKKNVLIKGPSLSGKSRAIFESLKRDREPFDILIPICREINPDKIIIPHRVRFWRRGVVILDDLQRFVEQPGFEHLIRELVTRNYLIIASSRTGRDFLAVENNFARQGLDIRSIFHDYVVEIPFIDEERARNIAKRSKIEWGKVSFNGTIGSVFMELLEMKTRFQNASEDEKAVLRALKKLYLCGVFLERGTFLIQWIRRIFSNDNNVLNSTMESLHEKEFFKVNNSTIEIEPVYLEDITTLFPKIGFRELCHELANSFNDDPQVLMKIGDRLRDTGRDLIKGKNCIKDSITFYNQILESRKISKTSFEFALALDHLGVAHAMLADLEEKKENAKESVKAHINALNIFSLERFPMNYAQTQHNLGIVYGILAEIENPDENSNLAISSCKKALKIYTKEKFPMAYAMTQNNLGIAYGNLVKWEHELDDIKRSISAFNEALKYLPVDRFPYEYAMTQLNLGNAFSNLSKFENSKENCQKAIAAYNESIRIFTIEKRPRDHAMAENGLGITYQLLSKIENRTENCQQSIIAFKEALAIFTKEVFPEQYAEVKANLALTYWSLAYAQDIEYVNQAIDSWKSSLDFFTIDKSPDDYARIKNNLGAAYLALAKIKNKRENCISAILSINEALRIWTFEGYPQGFAIAQFDLGTAHSFLAEIEDRPENCRKPQEAYQSKRNLHDGSFPH